MVQVGHRLVIVSSCGDDSLDVAEPRLSEIRFALFVRAGFGVCRFLRCAIWDICGDSLGDLLSVNARGEGEYPN
jgi:hypothetical protein